MGIKSQLGYSGTPLVRKLGLKTGFVIRILHQPFPYKDFFPDFPDDVEYAQDGTVLVDFVHYFATDAMTLEKELPGLRDQLKQKGMIWISWPKKTSKIHTELDGNLIRTIGLKNGLVDIKVCSVNEIWSALKFVIPVKDRK